jgi:hypothetical protein
VFVTLLRILRQKVFFFAVFFQERLCRDNRVTRLGEFSPIGQLFILGSLFKISEVGQIL